MFGWGCSIRALVAAPGLVNNVLLFDANVSIVCTALWWKLQHCLRICVSTPITWKQKSAEFSQHTLR